MKNLNVNNNFFLRIKYYSQIIETQFYYNLTDVPCNHLKNLTIDFDNLPSKFQNKIKGPCDDYEGEYGYVLSRRNEKQKFMLMLFYNHKGNYFSVTYNHKSALMDANRENLIYFLAFTGCFLLLLFPCCKKYCCEECCSCRGCCDCFDCNCDCCCLHRKSKVKSDQLEVSDKTDKKDFHLQSLKEEKKTSIENK